MSLSLRTFRFALIPVGLSIFLAACLAQKPSAGVIPAPAPFAPAPPAGMAGPDTASPDSPDDPAAPAPGDERPPDETAETPMTVVGVPVAMTPTDPFCVVSSTQISFEDLETAVTGKSDAEGRPETLFRARVVGKRPEGPAWGIQKGNIVSVYDTAFPDSDPWRMGTGSQGCIMLKIYSPPGRVVRFLASVPCCPPEIGVGEVTEAVAALKVELTCAPRVGEMTLTVPAETEAKSVSRCDGWGGMPDVPPSRAGSEVLEPTKGEFQR